MWAIPTGASSVLKKKKKKKVPVLSLASRKPVRIRQSGRAGIRGVTVIHSTNRMVTCGIEGDKRRHLFSIWPSTCSGGEGEQILRKGRVFRERKSNFSLDFQCSDRWISSDQEAKLFYAVRATRGHQF